MVEELVARYRRALEEGGIDPATIEIVADLLRAYLSHPAMEEVVPVMLTQREATTAHFVLRFEHDWASKLGGDSQYAADIAAVIGHLEEAFPTLKPAAESASS